MLQNFKIIPPKKNTQKKKKKKTERVNRIFEETKNIKNI